MCHKLLESKNLYRQSASVNWESSQLICITDQLADFYMMGNIDPHISKNWHIHLNPLQSASPVILLNDSVMSINEGSVFLFFVFCFVVVVVVVVFVFWGRRGVVCMCLCGCGCLGGGGFLSQTFTGQQKKGEDTSLKNA